MEAVAVEHLVKVFRDIKALNGISFHVEEGEIFGLIGPNGAGKTTTLRIIATVLLPTSGRVEVFGHDVVKEAEEVRRLISYLPEDAGAYKNLTGREYIEFIANLYTSDKGIVKEMVDLAEEICGLGDRLSDKIKTYSKGMKRRLLLAKTFMVKPRLAIVDEPTSGLDVIHAVYVRRLIKEFARKHRITILLSSHNMLEVEYLCDRVALINKGSIIEEGKPEELKEKYSATNLEEVFIKAVRGSVV